MSEDESGQTEYRIYLQALDLRNQVESDFRSVPKGPLAAVLVKAQADAVRALAKLVVVDPFDPSAIQPLQNEVRRYEDMIEYVFSIVAAGDEAGTFVTKADADFLAQTVGLDKQETNDA